MRRTGGPAPPLAAVSDSLARLRWANPRIRMLRVALACCSTSTAAFAIRSFSDRSDDESPSASAIVVTTARTRVIPSAVRSRRRAGVLT